MANILKHKQSSVAGKVPATTDLALGELAINTRDGKLYLKKNVSGTETIVDVTAGGLLPASASTLGGVKGLTNLTIDGVGNLSLSGTNVTNALGYTPLNKAGDTLTGNLISNYAIGLGVASPARQIHTAGSSGSEWLIEHTGSKANGRKWNHVVFNTTTPSLNNASYRLRILNDAGTGDSLMGFNIDGDTGKFTTTARMIDPASVPPGSIIQAKWVDMGGGNWSAVTSSYANSGFGASITPQFASSKIIHIVTVGVVALCDGNVVIARNGTIVSPSLADNYRTIGSWDWYNDMAPLSFTWMDSPNTTSSTAYNLYGRATGCGNSIVIGSSSDFTCSWLMLEVAA